MTSPYIHPRELLKHKPAVTDTPAQLNAILHGRQVRLPDFSGAPRVKVFATQDLLARKGGAPVILGFCFQP